MKKTLFLVAGLLAAPFTLANGYVGLSYAFLETDVGMDFDTPTLNLAVGGELNENLALEARLGFGTDEDSSFGLDLEIDKYLAVYLKPMLPISDTVSLYALLGYAETTLDSNFGDEDDSDISYGFGASFSGDSNVHFFAEYLNLYDDDEDGVDVEISGFNLGVNLSF